MRAWCALAAALTLLAACGGGGRTPGHREVAVDSVLPREEALRRFREGLPRATALTEGAPTLDSLVRAVTGALERNDSAALRALVVSQAEFAWLYYPTSTQGLPPYDLSPGLYWFILQGRNQQGLAFLLSERAGRPLHLLGHECGPTTTREGANTLHGPCLVRRLQAPGDTITERFFSQIVERGGRFKVLTYYGDRD